MVFNIGSIGNIFGQIGRAVSVVNSVRNFAQNPASIFTSLLGGIGGGGIGFGGGGGGGSSYTFENEFARLVPFQLSGGGPMSPILETGGLVFPYNPTISEGISVRYESIELTHTNEAYYAYKNTENVRIVISDAVWTCDTFSNAVYALAVIHFLRAYSFMDFGRFKTGRPPSPMWFSAYGNYGYNRVPVLMEKADWSFPNDIDYVGVPEPGSAGFNAGILATDRSAGSDYTWIPVKFTVSNISLIVQHSPRYWTNFSLADYYNGQTLQRSGSFHSIGPGAFGSLPLSLGATGGTPVFAGGGGGSGGGGTTRRYFGDDGANGGANGLNDPRNISFPDFSGGTGSTTLPTTGGSVPRPINPGGGR